MKRNYYNETNHVYRKDVDSICKITCKCGHVIFIPVFVDKLNCTWCGRDTYRDKKKEFEERLIKELKKC